MTCHRPLSFTTCLVLLVTIPNVLSQSELSDPRRHESRQGEPLTAVSDLFAGAEDVIAQLGQSLEDAIRRYDEDAFLSLFSLPERSMQGLRAWFGQVRDLAGTAAGLEVTFALPILGVQETRILGINGLLHVSLSTVEGTTVRDLPLNAVCLIRTGESWSIGQPEGGEFPADPGLTVTSASFATRPHPDEQSLAARAVFTVRNDGETPLESLPFYLRFALRFSEATIDGRPARGAMSLGTLGGMPAARLDLDLDTPLNPAETREVTFAWTTSFARHQFGRKPLGFEPDRGFILWESGWYPHAATDFIMIPYRMEITAPPGCLALTSGTLTGRRPSADGEVFAYDCTLPAPPYLLWGRYIVSTAEIGGTGVEIWTPASGGIAPEPMRARLAEILAFYGRILPPTTLSGHRVVAVTRFGGYGPPGNLLLEDTHFALEALARAENVDLVAHELAHSWVNSIALPGGDLLLPLSEGIATFLGPRAVEEILGPGEAVTLWAERQMSYLPLFRRTVPPAELTETIQYADNAMFRVVTYNKSAFFLREMATLLGEEAFFGALRETLLAHQGGEFTFDDLADALARADGEVVTDAYRRWKDERDLPDYVLYPASGDPGSGGPVVLVNEGAPSPVPVRVVGCDDAGRTVRETTCIPAAGERITLPFHPGGEIVSIRIDPEVRILQKEPRNDIYPDWLPPVAEQEALRATLERFFLALREKDVEAAAALLTGDRELMDDSVRNRTLAFVGQGPHDITMTGEGRCFATGTDRIEIEVPVRYVAGGAEQALTGAFTCVREAGGWRIVVFSIN